MILVMVPASGRRQQVERLLKSHEQNTGKAADLVFILDPGDEETYDGVDWGDSLAGVMSPRGTFVEKLNRTALDFANDYDALMLVRDDCVFATPQWDELLTEALEAFGGTAMLQPDDRKRDDVPEIILISSDIVRELGWFANPAMGHFYIDNTWAELGKRAELLHRCPGVVIPYLHYTLGPDVAIRDDIDAETETAWGASDLMAFRQWQSDVLPNQASQLRRKFNPDVQWILSKIQELCDANNGERDGSQFRDRAVVLHSRRAVQRHVLEPVRDGNRLHRVRSHCQQLQRADVPLHPHVILYVHRK